MTTVAVTGAAGSVGRRVVKALVTDPGVELVKGFDRVAMAGVTRADLHQIDVTDRRLGDLLVGCRSLIHLADDPSRRSNEDASDATVERVLAAAERAGCAHVVVLSSAMVYGAHADNPIPLTEHHALRPVPALRYAAAKARLEEVVLGWSERTGASVAVLRPTTTLSERGVSYVSRVMRSAMALRPPTVTAPIQFLHHDDLTAAIIGLAVGGRGGIFNVAPDGWIEPEVFSALRAEELAWPEPLQEARAGVARMVRRRPVDRALAAFVTHPWVVANDRLRETGWSPGFSNEEAYVVGTPEPMWHRYASRRRQELALGAGGAIALGGLVGAALAARRLLR